MATEVLVAIVGGGFTLINAVFAAMKEGGLSILRDSIITMHDRQVDAGTMPLYMRDALEHSYNAYHALGGNGTVAALYKELLELPID